MKLQLTDQIQSQKWVKFARYAKLLGNGLTAIEFGRGIGEVRTSYQSGGDWNRQLFIESFSFTMSTVAGSAVAGYGTAALMFLVAATPIGWVGLIVAGVAVAGLAAGGASMGASYYLKDLNNAEKLYDLIR